MIMKHNNIFFFVFLWPLFFVSCQEQSNQKSYEIPPISVNTTTVKLGNIENTLILNGKTIYLKKNEITAPISAFVAQVHVQFGDIVNKNDLLFELQTKESKVLQNEIGQIKIFAPADGIISHLWINNEGGFVSENQLLCTIIENKDVMIQAEAPYEISSQIKTGLDCNIILPNEKTIAAKIVKILPSINESNQTQSVLIQSIKPFQLPENLNLSIEIISSHHENSILVDKNAIMCNEEQNEFWVMRIIDDSLAIKTPISKGFENDSVIEIISGNLLPHQILVSQGAYGLADSTVVKISK